MTETKIDGRFTFSKPVTLITFKDDLFEPRPFERAGVAKGEPKYGSRFLVPLTDAELVAQIKAKAAEVARLKWPGRPLNELLFPFKNGDTLYSKKQAELTAAGKPDEKRNDFYKGQFVVIARSKYPPVLSALENGKVVEYGPAKRQALKARLYSGALVVPSLNLVPYDGGSNQDGVTAYLDQLLWYGGGKQLMGHKSATEVFRGFQGQASAENPMAGAIALDDDIPF